MTRTGGFDQPDSQASQEWYPGKHSAVENVNHYAPHALWVVPLVCTVILVGWLLFFAVIALAGWIVRAFILWENDVIDPRDGPFTSANFKAGLCVPIIGFAIYLIALYLAMRIDRNRKRFQEDWETLDSDVFGMAIISEPTDEALSRAREEADKNG